MVRFSIDEVELPSGVCLKVLKEERRQIKNSKYKESFLFCRCVCGEEKWFRRASILYGTTKSCGCVGKARIGRDAKKHGGCRLRMYWVWMAMRQRCENENDSEYENYGGRGVSVCSEWREFVVYRNYVLSLLPGGTTDIPKGMTIDRFPNQNGNYEPGNIRIATFKQQARNTRRNRMITINGETKCVAEWSEVYGIRGSVIHGRLRYGWSEVDAVTKPQTRGKR